MPTAALLDALHTATAGFRERLIAIPEDILEFPSVCEGWSIKDVADHIVGGNRFAFGLLEGMSAHDALTGAFLGGFDPPAVDLFDASAAAQHEAFSQPGALDRLVDHPAGIIAGDEFLRLRIGDLVLHGWDLARSTGTDDTLDPTLTPMLIELYQRRAPAPPEELSTPQQSTVDHEHDRDLGVRLLALSGRTP